MPAAFNAICIFPRHHPKQNQYLQMNRNHPKQKVLAFNISPFMIGGVVVLCAENRNNRRNTFFPFNIIILSNCTKRKVRLLCGEQRVQLPTISILYTKYAGALAGILDDYAFGAVVSVCVLVCICVCVFVTKCVRMIFFFVQCMFTLLCCSLIKFPSESLQKMQVICLWKMSSIFLHFFSISKPVFFFHL